MKKRAFTLIELVITIVIVGIVSLSFPMILMQSNKNIAFATQQEAILAAKTYIGTILSYPWDNNIYTMGAGVKGMILETRSPASDNEFNRVVGTNLRVGNIDGSNRRRLVDNTSANPFPNATIPATPSLSPIDINGFNQATQHLNIAADDMDYIFSLTLTPTISYVSDAATDPYANDVVRFELSTGGVGGPTNIKMISMHVNNTDPSTPNVNITLRAYSANIGEIELLNKAGGGW
ncbi:MAG: prepilin-type N-terminal cleavage/methylation domain-containing protein [Campylobacteraceae bacterium]|jgi:prepilin-type N-terminal cleavage/methylation domain-containing protein|nr:prepilin-type N-terminal cleavage/methylation domain-containing protein [Campylobacteraceae bacterium]